ncbi:MULTISPECIES: PAS domain-containing protein [unclassified Brevundimonas]|uniref:PAS domain-containing protein n=1 Tax=unclassified Brevundimonas TaxID=2622653 RepID=UPI0025BB7A3B|nr:MULTISPECIES: PAS domain-containing protein [unclassified Brevundimonas]
MSFTTKSIEALDAPAGPFHRLVDLAATMFDCRAAVVTLLTPTEAVIRSNAGLCSSRTPRENSLAPLVTAMGRGAVLVIPDTTLDPRVNGHPIVTGHANLRFFAAATVCGPDGAPIGALSVLHDHSLPMPSDREQEQLRLLAGMAEDIIAGIEAARIRDERLETLRLVEQMSGVGHWRLERNTGVVEWSDEVYRIHGVERDSFDPNLDSALDFYVEGDRQALTEMIQRGLEDGEGYMAKLQIVRPDGEERRVLTHAETEVDETGRVVAMFGVFQDVTEQEKVLARSRRDEGRYRLLAENIGDVITRVKMDGSSKYISPAIQQLLGWTFEEMSGQSTDYVHPEDRHLVLKAIGEAVKTGTPTRLEHRAVHRKGHTIWVECTFKALKDENGHVDDVVVVIRDMTQRRVLEDQVIEAKERAEKAAQAKSEFLANMSHELRTPLTSVIGFSGLLQGSEALPPEERTYVERIATASEALLGVINDILDYSKLEANAIEMDPEPFQVAALVDGAAAIVEGQCVAKGLSLKVVADAAMPEVLTGDAGRLRQVMLNFLSNAVKFTGKGGVTLRVGGAPDPDGRWRLRVAVTDTGIGIPAEKIEVLFERFSQADASTTRVYGGTGLGLAISRRLIEIMGGEIGVDSKPGEGATFWFETPLIQGGSAAGLTGGDDEMAASGGLAGGRILMADDAPGNRELVSAILRGLGLEIDTVCDGAEAVQAMQSGSYDLVLMDVHMPVMDGLTATREIRRMQAGSGHRTPILALTANVQADQVARCLDSGMDGHLAKPIQIPELAGALAHWLAGGDPAALAS